MKFFPNSRPALSGRAGPSSLSLTLLALLLSVQVKSNDATDEAVTPKSGSSTGTAASNSSSPESDEGYQALDIINKSQMGILKMRGYSGQVHYAVNRDGYYIHLVRIINPLIRDRSQLKRPVVFNHGLLESSTIWLIGSKDVKPVKKEGLCATLPIDPQVAKNQSEFANGPMMLANQGYDVWLMSMRGTDYSLYHQTMDPSMPEFWDYSLDNFALDDIPSVINYIRRHTGAKKIGYVGHSQATFSVFALLASRPRYADIIEPVFAVAPVAYMHHTTSVVSGMFMAALATPHTMHMPVPESAKRMRASFTRICAKSVLGLNLNLACGLSDMMSGGIGKGARKGYFSHLPFHTSLKVLRHFGQIVTKKKFTMYDHGAEENMKRYGVAEAPTYKIGNIKSRALVLIWTKTDNLSPVADVERFKSELTVPLYRDVFIDREFNHFDLITHQDASYLVFAPMLQVLEEFEQKNGMCRIEANEIQSRN